MRKIIFLDIDGVLNSMAYFKNVKEVDGFNEISEFHLQKLSEIYHAAGAEIVLCSTWRTLQVDNEMYQYLVNSLDKYDMRISDKTPVIGMNRPLEIFSWLEDQSEEVQFVILDDDYPTDEYEEYGLEDHLVRTVFYCFEESEGGLQDTHVEKAIEILKSSCL